MSNKIDAQVTALFNVLQTKKAELEETKKAIGKQWATNCSVTVSYQGAPVNIQTASEGTILGLVSYLLITQDYQARAAKELGIPAVSKFAGAEFSEWIQDCKKRIAKLSVESKKTELDTLETRLNAIVSPEQKRQLELEALTKALSV